MSETLDLPFSEWIAPETLNSGIYDLEPPAYARNRGFSYNLDALADNGSFRFTPGKPFDYEALQEATTLDPAQQASVLHALSSELALIQGPPGTGKSYTGVALVQTLLKSRKAADLGPILIVCYTNHALDQFLESLIRGQVGQIIRLGSRSHSEVLEKLTLHHLVHEMEQTKTEGQEKWRTRNEHDVEVAAVEIILSRLDNVKSWTSIRDYLQEYHPQHFTQLFQTATDEEGFQLVQEKEADRLGHWLRGPSNKIYDVSTIGADPEGKLVDQAPRSLARLKTTLLLDMSVEERRLLYNYWVKTQTEVLSDELLRALDSYNDAKAALEKCNREINLRCLLEAQIVGCTTTGLARNLDVLRRVRTKVVVVEEAGKSISNAFISVLTQC